MTFEITKQDPEYACYLMVEEKLRKTIESGEYTDLHLKQYIYTLWKLGIYNEDTFLQTVESGMRANGKWEAAKRMIRDEFDLQNIYI